MPALLPDPVGPISAAVRQLLDTRAGGGQSGTALPPLPDDPLDLDAQLGLFILHELSYTSWQGVEIPERNLRVVDAVNRLNGWFEARLRDVIPSGDGAKASDVLETVIAAPGPSIPRYVEAEGTLGQLAESLLLRSPYQSKEADPHTRAIPRLGGRAKAALIEIQTGEYGVGHQFSHAELFARALRSLGFDPTPAAHLNACTAAAIATSNLVSMTGSQRRLRGALLGQLSLFEMDSVAPNELMVRACDRLGAPSDVRRFFHVHVMADDEHEAMAADGFLHAFVEDEPDQEHHLIFGIQAQAYIDTRHANDTVTAWQAGRSAMRGEPVRLDAVGTPH